MKYFDLSFFLNKFFKNKKYFFLKQVWICLKYLYGLNIYSSQQICFMFGLNMFILNKYLSLYMWKNIYFYLKYNFNFFLYDSKIINLKNIYFTKNYKAWKHIFNLPVNGQRNRTNAKTRKKFKIY